MQHQNTSLEARILCLIWHNSRAAYNLAMTAIPSDRVFTTAAHRAAWHIVRIMDENGLLPNHGEIDPADWFEIAGQHSCEIIGGSPKQALGEAITDLPAIIDQRGMLSQIDDDLRRLVDLYRRRLVIDELAAIQAKIAEPGVDPYGLWSQTTQRIEDIGGDKGALATYAQAESDFQAYQDARAQMGDITPLWGLESLDQKAPLGLGRYMVCAARPGGGKTGLGIHSAIMTAASGVSVALLSLELSQRDLMEKVLGHPDSAKARENLKILAGQKLTPSQLAQQIKTISRAGVKYLIVDYLQLTTREHGRATEYETITATSTVCREGAVAENCCILALAQLNRDSAKQKGPTKPGLSDLRGSGSIEQDANTCVFIHQHDTQKTITDIDLLVPKNRFGPVGQVEAVWDKAAGTFKQQTEIKSTGDVIQRRETDGDEEFYREWK